MRHPLGWADLEGARVGVFGAGVEGRAALARLGRLTNDVVVVDDDPAVQLDAHEVLLSSGPGRAALAACDVVIKSPGISAYRPDVVDLRDAGVALVGGLGLTLHEVDTSRLICVTGTKGKSTTSSVLGHLLQGLGRSVTVAGNIGRPPFDPSFGAGDEVMVVETSSFQALDVADAPGMVIVTSLAADHLDWHGSVEQYHADKLSLTSLPGAGITLAQEASPDLRAHRDLLGGTVEWISGTAGPWAAPLGLLGDHNLANAEMARHALVALGIAGADAPDALARAAVGYEGLPGRLSDVGTIGGVRFVDDGLATNVLPTLAALASFPTEPLAILVGGFDRGVDYSELVETLRAREAPTLVIGLPDSGTRIVDAIATKTQGVETVLARSVAEATTIGATWAQGRGLVLLSPAAPSFSQFASWKERSQAFRDAVAMLEPTETDTETGAPAP